MHDPQPSTAPDLTERGHEQTLTHLTPTGPLGGDRLPDITPLGVPPDLLEHSRYRIVGLLGEGGMGAVWKAEHLVMDRLVALKVIHPRFTADPATADRFRREVRTAARLHHENIVRAYDAEQAGQTHFLVMEFVDGIDLSTLLKEQGRLSVIEACRYVLQAANGLQHAHEKGFVHRDIKPSNLIRAADGTVKILDFGLARFAHVVETLADTSVHATAGPSDLTAVGAIMGTPDYIAPEQAVDSGRADIRADIYSLGCTLFHLLAGEPVFASGSATDRIVAHMGDRPRPLAEVRPDAPPALGEVLTRMLAKEPGERYQTPADVAEALRPFTTAPGVSLEELEGSLKDFQFDEPERYRVPAWLIWVVVLTVSAGVALGLRLLWRW